MNMISTGAFQTEMDASNKQTTLAEKFAAVWEKKNAKAARAGGVSLMALSLAACSSDSDEVEVAVAAVVEAVTDAAETAAETTTVTEAVEEVAEVEEVVEVVVETPVGNLFNMTPLDDVASSTTAVNGAIQSDFRFTSIAGGDTVNGITASIQANDTLLDPSTTDADVINITSTGAMNAMTAVSIETANVTMASGAATAVFTNFTGLSAVNVSGSVAGTVTNAGTATIASNDYTRILTVEADLSGTAALSTSNTIDMSISGASYGTTVATQSVLLIDNTDAGTDTVETLNIASNGSAANVFYLNASADTDFEAVNITGSAGATVRMDHADATGITIAAATNTGDVDLSIDRQGATTTATNLLNVGGAETITLRDSTAGGDTANLTGVASGQSIVLSTDFTGATISMAGAARTAQAATITVELDNSTASTDVDIAGNLDIQDTATINIISNGNPSTATAGTVENAFTLVGDASTVTLTGDTQIDATLNIDSAGATGLTARAVSVDASAMTGTAYVELAAAASALVSYTMVGTANSDELVANAAGSSLTGGDGNDTLTGGAGGDTILGGAGIDAINAGAGTNTVTVGAGVDTITFGDADIAVAAGVDTITIGAITGMTAADTVAVTIAGVTKTYTMTAATVAGNDGADNALIESDLVDFINAGFSGVTALGAAGTTITLTYDTAIDATVVTTIVTNTNGNGTVTIAETAAGNDAQAVATSVTDFTTGATGDVIAISVGGINGDIVNLSESNGNVTAADAVVLIDFSGTAITAGNIGAADNVIKVAYAAGINSAADYLGTLTSNITLDAALDTGDGVATVFYDADNGNAVLGFTIADDGNAVIDEDHTFNEIGTFTMTQAEYLALDATNFSFVA
jgi:hypothetical protein